MQVESICVSARIGGGKCNVSEYAGGRLQGEAVGGAAGAEWLMWAEVKFGRDVSSPGVIELLVLRTCALRRIT